MAVELAAMSQNGLTYATDHYDIERYERLRTLAAELLATVGGPGVGGADVEEFRRALAAEAGHATPKVDVRGALFDAAGRVLLVRERRDGRWTLPGGWADALDTPATAAEREFAEEAGLAVRATRLAALHDGSRRNRHAGSPWHVYKLLFLVERADPDDVTAPTAGLDGETTGAAFFEIDDLPELSFGRCTPEQLRLLRDHRTDRGRSTVFD